MLSNRSLISLVLVCWSTALYAGTISRGALADEVVPNSTPTLAPETVPTVTPTPATPPTELPPAIPTPATPPVVTPPGQTKVLATHLVLKLKERKVYAYQDQKVLASYGVAIGKKGWETPKGKFQVIQLIRDPIWQNPWNGRVSPPGPKSPLGERWIGFWTNGKNYIGFHGTPGEHVIGQAVSHGCVRMRNKDIKALFDIVQMGIPVIVQ